MSQPSWDDTASPGGRLIRHQGITWAFFETLDSTQAEAKRWLEAGQVNQPTVIVASQQTEGRGTQGRQWHNSGPNQAWLFTLALAHQAPIALPLSTHYTLLAAEACQVFFQQHFQLGISIHGVNDLYIGGAKLGGILTESFSSVASHFDALLTGIGINVLPLQVEAERLRHPSTCLMRHGIDTRTLAQTPLHETLTPLIRGLIEHYSSLSTQNV